MANHKYVIFETRVCTPDLHPTKDKEAHIAFHPSDSKRNDDWQTCFSKGKRLVIAPSYDHGYTGNSLWGNEWANIYRDYCVYYGSDEIGYMRDRNRIVQINGMMFDFDSHTDKDMPVEDIRKILLSEEFEKQVPYSSIVFTGNGFQVHFNCDVPIPNEHEKRESRLETFQDYTEAIREYFRTEWKLKPDETCKEPNHNYRYPGTWNTKAVKSYEDKASRKKAEIVKKKEGTLKEAQVFLNDIYKKYYRPSPKVSRSTPSVKNSCTGETKIRSALEFIDISKLTYDEWLRVGMALHFWDSIKGLDLWHDWSEEDERYKASELDSKWKGFEDKGITLGTLFDLAKKHGWKPEPNKWNYLNYFEVNGKNEQGKDIVIKIARPWDEVTHKLKDCAGDRLFACQGLMYGKPELNGDDLIDLSDSTKFFAWLGTLYKEGTLDWISKVKGAITENKAFENVLRDIPKYRMLETAPHHPVMLGAFYNYPPLPAPEHDALDKLIGRFNPQTPEDKVLILSMFMSSVWGGEVGHRPAFVICSPDGKAVGKTTLIYKMAMVLGQSAIVASTKENMETLKTRLLSSDAMKKRIVLFDNECGRVDSDSLAQMITSRVISGRKLYEGEGERPNNLIWTVTLNTTHLSGDLASRSIPIHIIKSKASGDEKSRSIWEQDTDRLINGHRLGILSALIDLLQKDVPKPHDIKLRWTIWANDVLSRACSKLGIEYGAVEKVLLDRQNDCDSDQDEVYLIEEKIEEYVRGKKADPESGTYFISGNELARIFMEATGAKGRNNSAIRELKDLARLGRINITSKRMSRPSRRGYLWTKGANYDERIYRLDGDYVTTVDLADIKPDDTDATMMTTSVIPEVLDNKVVNASDDTDDIFL